MQCLPCFLTTAEILTRARPEVFVRKGSDAPALLPLVSGRITCVDAIFPQLSLLQPPVRL
jgi:hypothetical protein